MRGYILSVGILLLAITGCGSSSDSVSLSSSLSKSSLLASSSSKKSSSSYNFPGKNSPISLVLPALVKQKVVRFTYFVEKGESYSQADYDAIKAMAFALQQYWYEQFGGTFYLYGNVVDTIYADYSADYYLSLRGGFSKDVRWARLDNISSEVFSKMHISYRTQNTRIINYPTTRHDGRVGASGLGVWMDGDDLSCMSGDNNGYNFPFGDGSPAHCMGHVAHEFGHVYGLDHTGPSNGCMQYGFYISSTRGAMCDFFDQNVRSVVSSSMNKGWLDAMPGEVVNPRGQVEAR